MQKLSRISALFKQYRSFSVVTIKDISLDHLKRLKNLYSAAPISGLFNEHDIDFAKDGSTSIRFTPKKEHCHTMLSMHGSGYFKMLDDAAFFAAQAHDEENFVFTTSFTTYLVRPVEPGVPLIAHGKIENAGRSLQVASSRILEEGTGNLVATGSGTFMKSPHRFK